MKIGTDQCNTFDTMTMDCWNDRVYYEGKEFPAGHFAAEILNFAGAIHDPLLERITVLTALVDDLSTAEKSERHDIAAQLKPLLHDTVSWLYTCPPFCYCEEQCAYEDLEHALSEERLDRDYEEEEAHLPYLALSFCEPILRILVAIYNFCLLIRAFEKKYLRRAKRRNADAFAKAAHECFDEDDSFLILLEQMPFGGVEEFFSYRTAFRLSHDADFIAVLVHVLGVFNMVGALTFYGFTDDVEHTMIGSAIHFNLRESRAKTLGDTAMDNLWLELPWWF